MVSGPPPTLDRHGQEEQLGSLSVLKEYPSFNLLFLGVGGGILLIRQSKTLYENTGTIMLSPVKQVLVCCS